VLMEDLLTATDERLSHLKDLEEVRKRKEYTIDFSDAIKLEVSEIWQKLQSGKLHQHPTVIAENNRAARIVRELFLVLSVNPKLIPASFRSSHERLSTSSYMQWYKERVGTEIGIPKRLLAKYAFEHTIGSSPQAQGDHWQTRTQDLIMAKDYVASLTDQSATQAYEEYCVGVAR